MANYSAGVLFARCLLIRNGSFRCGNFPAITHSGGVVAVVLSRRIDHHCAAALRRIVWENRSLTAVYLLNFTLISTRSLLYCLPIAVVGTSLQHSSSGRPQRVISSDSRVQYVPHINRHFPRGGAGGLNWMDSLQTGESKSVTYHVLTQGVRKNPVVFFFCSACCCYQHHHRCRWFTCTFRGGDAPGSEETVICRLVAS